MSVQILSKAIFFSYCMLSHLTTGLTDKSNGKYEEINKNGNFWISPFRSANIIEKKKNPLFYMQDII